MTDAFVSFENVSKVYRTGEVEIREGQPDYTGRICVIGSGLKEDALKALFAGAAD